MSEPTRAGLTKPIRFALLLAISLGIALLVERIWGFPAAGMVAGLALVFACWAVS
jgi:hypothetical protein